MSLLKIARAPVVTVSPKATVLEAVRVMDEAEVGAVLVVEGESLKGIFSERDLMLRVVLKKRTPETTTMEQVMTSPVETVPQEMSEDDALKLMLERHIRHLPIVTGEGKIEGMISIRNLLQQKLEELTQELDSLESYLGADGIGG